MAEEISITFDEQNKIRVLDAEKYRETEQLKIESMDFIKKVLALDEVVQNLNETLEEYSKKIEIEKLRAIGEVLKNINFQLNFLKYLNQRKLEFIGIFLQQLFVSNKNSKNIQFFSSSKISFRKRISNDQQSTDYPQLFL